jgi:hypothetical protein
MAWEYFTVDYFITSTFVGARNLRVSKTSPFKDQGQVTLSSAQIGGRAQ